MRTKITSKQTTQIPLPPGPKLSKVRKGQRVVLADGTVGIVSEVTYKELRGFYPDFWLRPLANPEYELGCKYEQGVYEDTTF